MPVYSQFLDPNGTNNPNWTVTGAATAHEALDDAIRQPATPNSDRISTAADAIFTRLLQTTYTLVPSESVVGVRIWVFAVTSGGCTIDVELGDFPVGAGIVPENHNGWFSVTHFPFGLTQGEIDGLFIDLQSHGVGIHEVHAQYVELITVTPGGGGLLMGVG